jgi:uncharacterized protein YyaL (SSP411 family)
VFRCHSKLGLSSALTRYSRLTTQMTSESTGQKSNRLISEKSPYLLQHAHNPVDWYPWGPEAFEKAKKQDKPIFLSIGYSTCHWCHVMEKESFENLEVAGLLNETFVCIKVDREERPDLDAIYMKVCQTITGTGGWPLHIVMTPDKEPFFAATYIPNENKFGQVGLKQLIPRIKNLWISNRNMLLNTAQQIVDFAKQPEEGHSLSVDAVELGELTLHRAFIQLSQLFDENNGGFGNAPKFPSAQNLTFLLRYWKRTSKPKALHIVEKTLNAMRLGGIYDHLGYGFHRYSTDSRWRVPHFEKTLYDQAMLTMAYTEAYQATGNDEYENTARQIITYVLRNMVDSQGAFYSAEDADSEGEEGNFYLWTESEIRQLLTDDEADLVSEIFNVKVNGNFEEARTSKKTGKNILYQDKPLVEIASDLHVSKEEFRTRFEVVRQKMLFHRDRRVHPSKDDKVLTDWNGLFIAALAKAARAFDRPEYMETAKKAADFLLEKLFDPQSGLRHRYRDGQTKIPGFLDDYTFLVWALIEIFEGTFEIRYLKRAISLTEQTIEKFWDRDQGGFFFTADNVEITLVRNKIVSDGAYPSGNSIAALNLIRLARLSERLEFEVKAEHLLRSLYPLSTKNPSAFAQLMIALDFVIGPSSEVTIVGDLLEAQTKEMLGAVNCRFFPRTSVLFESLERDDSGTIDVGEFRPQYIGAKGKATAYVCRKKVCVLPVTDVKSLIQLLESE